MKLALYVDGFNLYFRLLRGQTGTKWLDLCQLARRLFPNDELVIVRYFTARIKALGDPDAPQRQLIYLRALATLPEVAVTFGYFQLMEKPRYLATPVEGLPASVRVILPEEKGSDVNLATHLLADGFRGLYEKAAVITNDADLKEPIRVVEHELGLPVTLVHPSPAPAGELRKANPSGLLKLSRSTVRQCQFPEVLEDGMGQFRKPPTW